MRPNPGSRRRPRSRGQALTEFALVIPIFLLVLSGILDFGFLLYSRMTVISAAREGAHAAITLVGASTTSTIPGKVISTAPASASGLTSANLSVPTPACLVPPVAPSTTWTSCNWTAYDATTNPTGAQSGDFVSVTVNYQYKSFFPLLFGSTFNLSSTIQMVLE